MNMLAAHEILFNAGFAVKVQENSLYVYLKNRDISTMEIQTVLAPYDTSRVTFYKVSGGVEIVFD